MNEREATRRRGLRWQLERALDDLADVGVIPRAGEREIRLRLDEGGSLRWLESWRVRMPASEIDAATPS